jgi:uncharacterized protein YjiS (DUF1127 family)
LSHALYAWAAARWASAAAQNGNLFQQSLDPNAREEPAMIANLLHAIRRWTRARAGELALSRLDDRALSDIGISRSDIPRVAWDKTCR